MVGSPLAVHITRTIRLTGIWDLQTHTASHCIRRGIHTTYLSSTEVYHMRERETGVISLLTGRLADGNLGPAVAEQP
jgi:hypothetical protein